MSGSGTKAPVVAVIDWRAAATLKGNAGLIRRAGLADAGRGRRRPLSPGHRSLVVRADGSGELQRFTAGTAARRLLVPDAGAQSRKAGTERSG